MRENELSDVSSEEVRIVVSFIVNIYLFQVSEITVSHLTGHINIMIFFFTLPGSVLSIYLF